MGEPNIVLREAAPEDAGALLAIYRPYILKTAITFEVEVPTKENFAERIRKTEAFYPYLVAEREEKILGYAYAGRFHPRAAYDWCAESSIYLAMEERRRGAGGILCRALRTTVSSSTPTWDISWWGASTPAGTSSGPGTTWSGWKSTWDPIRRSHCRSAPGRRSEKRKEIERDDDTGRSAEDEARLSGDGCGIH